LGSEDKEMDFGVLHRGMRLSIWAEFCAWRAALRPTFIRIIYKTFLLTQQRTLPQIERENGQCCVGD